MENDNVVYSTHESRISMPLYVYIGTATKEYTMKYFHYHSGYEIYYLNSGNVNSTIGNKIYNLKKGNITIIPPYVPHRCEYYKCEKNTRMLINVSTEYLTDDMFTILKSFSETPAISIPLYHQDTVSSIFKKNA